MATAIYPERLEVDGVPLDCPAWEVTNNYSWLYTPAEFAVADYQPGGHAGEIPAPVLRGAKRGPLVMQLNGVLDPDGNEHGDVAAGLRANFDALLAALAPPQHTLTGTRELAHVHPAVATRSGPGRVMVVSTEFVAGVAATVTADCYLPRGVLASVDAEETTSPAIGSSTPFVVANSGSSFQEASTVTLSGSATGVLLESLSWDPDGAAFLYVDVDLSAGDVVIDTAAQTVTQAGDDVHGLVDAGLHVLRSWLPLVAGDNTIRVVPTGGNVTVTWSHHPAFR